MPTDVEIPIYKNKSLADLPGEIWKDIKGFEGSYQASNLGRIKSLDRTIAHPRLNEQFVQGRIMSFSIAKNKNIKTGEPMIDLRVSLSNDGRQYYFNVRRVIYKTFIGPRLDFKKNGKYVINIDGDGYNNQVNNLKLVTKREKQRRSLKESESILIWLLLTDHCGPKRMVATPKESLLRKKI